MYNIWTKVLEINKHIARGQNILITQLAYIEAKQSKTPEKLAVHTVQCTIGASVFKTWIKPVIVQQKSLISLYACVLKPMNLLLITLQFVEMNDTTQKLMFVCKRCLKRWKFCAYFDSEVAWKVKGKNRG